jgi:hypothetical protein
MAMIDQQLRRIYVSGIHKYAELNCVIHGEYVADAVDMITRYGGWRILECRPDDADNLRETRTLRYLWQDTRDDDAVVYMHTKGISYLSGERRIGSMTLARNLRAINSWRWAMEHYNIDRWVERFNCFRQNTCEVQGCFLNMVPYPHFSGNFWWSMGGHIRRLSDPTTIPATDRHHASKQWLFSIMPTYMCNFHILDKPREDGLYVYGAFRLHEDDCMQYCVEDQIHHPCPPLTAQDLL